MSVFQNIVKNALRNQFIRQRIYLDQYNPQLRTANERILSLNRSAIPFERVPPTLEEWRSTRGSRLTLFDERASLWLKRMQAYTVCRLSIWGFSIKKLKLEVKNMYTKINESAALGRMNQAQDLVAPIMLPILKNQSSSWMENGCRVEWSLAQEILPKDLTIWNAAYVRAPMDKSQMWFMQFVVQISSQQKFAVYDRRTNELMAGNPEEVLHVTDFWVVERKFLKSWCLPRPGPLGARWRLVKRLEPVKLPAAEHATVYRETEEAKVADSKGEDEPADYKGLFIMYSWTVIPIAMVAGGAYLYFF